MKKFSKFISEALNPDAILGRNLAARQHYRSLPPEEANSFLQALAERAETYNALLKTLKAAVETHLSRGSKLNITSGSNYGLALSNAIDDIRKSFPKLTRAQIARVFANETHSTLDMADELTDKLFPQLRKW